MLRVAADFPTANGTIVALPDGTILLDRDMRDSTGDRWYWHVRLHASTDVVARFRMARPSLLGQYGPAVQDGGPYAWLHREPGPDGRFEVALTAATETKLCATLPYGLRDIAAFRGHVGPDVAWRTLALSERLRQVPLLAVPAPAAERLIVLTARHHACEATASYVLEGAVACFIAHRRDGHRATAGCELLAAPMLDVDGVHQGDQGKARLPWDHNRDYGPRSMYRAVAALRALLSAEARTIYALDLHTPGLRGPMEERPYIVCSGDADDHDRASDLIAAFDQADHDDPADRPAELIFDEEWNSPNACGQRSCAAWMRSCGTNRLGLTIEYPNAVDRGVPVTSTRAR